MDRIEVAGLRVAGVLHRFIVEEALPGTGVEADAFWTGSPRSCATSPPATASFSRIRDALQERIDAWHRERAGRPHDPAEYERFLAEIGYLLPEPEPFTIATENVDDEIARIAGPQLVVPVSNARYALNAANARWGSLYDALYGTDAIPEEGGAERGGGLQRDPRRARGGAGQGVPGRGRAAGAGDCMSTPAPTASRAARCSSC